MPVVLYPSRLCVCAIHRNPRTSTLFVGDAPKDREAANAGDVRFAWAHDFFGWYPPGAMYGRCMAPLRTQGENVQAGSRVGRPWGKLGSRRVRHPAAASFRYGQATSPADVEHLSSHDNVYGLAQSAGERSQIFQLGPTGFDYHNPEAPARETLLVLHSAIGGDEHVNARGFSLPQ
ncbi:MAG TPA: hypothetical protein VFX98_15910 [Longimicrobiaceae bacterium]|nr:hypothetical protein [Longimicrobiaceae bacterium]